MERRFEKEGRLWMSVHVKNDQRQAAGISYLPR
jgi:hypothetical protein